MVSYGKGNISYGLQKYIFLKNFAEKESLFILNCQTLKKMFGNLNTNETLQKLYDISNASNLKHCSSFFSAVAL